MVSAKGLHPLKSRLGEHSEAPCSWSAHWVELVPPGPPGLVGPVGPVTVVVGEVRALPQASCVGGCLWVGTTVVPYHAAARARACQGRGSSLSPPLHFSLNPRHTPGSSSRELGVAAVATARVVAILPSTHPPSAVPPGCPPSRCPWPSSLRAIYGCVRCVLGHLQAGAFLHTFPHVPSTVWWRAAGRRETAAALMVHLGLQPQIRHGNLLNLSLLVSGGKAINEDLLSNGE